MSEVRDYMQKAIESMDKAEAYLQLIKAIKKQPLEIDFSLAVAHALVKRANDNCKEFKDELVDVDEVAEEN